VSRPPDLATSAPSAAPPARWTDDRLISIGDIRVLFKLGRTAAYELTHRPDFPEPVPISPRCYRWWASEVEAFADSLRRKRPDQCAAGGGTRRTAKPRTLDPATPPGRYQGELRLAGLVEGTRDGRRILYRLRGGHVRNLLREAMFHADHQVSGEPVHD